MELRSQALSIKLQHFTGSFLQMSAVSMILRGGMERHSRVIIYSTRLLRGNYGILSVRIRGRVELYSLG